MRVADRVIDARGGYLLPGFIQTHVHLCQTLFRSYADDMPLLEWLRRRIWPMEAAHTPATLRAAARLAAAELLLSGTTTALTMETVHDTDVVFETLADIGLRATVGKCMMDSDERACPLACVSRLCSPSMRALRLHKRWHGAAGGRLRAAFAPRFAVSCSRELLEAVGVAFGERRHPRPHACVRVARRSRGRPATVGRTLEPRVPRGNRPRDRSAVRSALRLGHRRRAGAPGRARRQGHALPRFEPEARIGHRARRRHAPPRHLRFARRRRRAPATISLDMFDEMRLAATLQAVRHAPGALTARDALWMATRDGARTLGLEAEIGSIEAGKRADLILVDRDRACISPPMPTRGRPWSMPPAELTCA